MPVHFDIMDNEVLGPLIAKALSRGSSRGAKRVPGTFCDPCCKSASVRFLRRLMIALPPVP